VAPRAPVLLAAAAGYLALAVAFGSRLFVATPAAAPVEGRKT
jgi:hypothetical protein